ncbi:hypothetical protein DICPUDRAFT_83372 [Dictyostelium purpureum]|uniref:Transmembrane protein n=1 Tax=Dictyostelium purpureum TaxID=5786 RepID=F0ZZC3_DICPU|nr:uncharacterized protein DICPUDRAFT_83372 [Dictyostelium purpureum]EGC30702.1 hypothetical protein DICPUDRAFT_83372 [Dictyostelium purpureum]|eukprot:XP_003292765.1 hypothetical protein DICPUDRAFT_83372 [Dictyostelium purpureum]
MNILKSLIVFLFFIVIVIKSQPLILFEKYHLSSGCSNSPSNCNGQVTYGTILKQSQCLNYLGVPSIFSTYDPLATIVQNKYLVPNCQGTYSQTKYFEGRCNGTCQGGNNYPFKGSLINDIDIPSNTWVSVSYSSPQCNGDFKDSFFKIEYSPMDFCEAIGSYSFKSTCNSSAVTYNTYSGSSCSFAPISTIIIPMANDCGDSNNNYNNYYQFCNN